MSVIAFVKQWAQWQSASPSSSASITPGAAGNALAVFGQNESGGSLPITPSAAAGTTLSPPGLVNDTNGDTHGISINLALTAPAQVATLTGSVGNSLEGVGVEYSGVGSVGDGDKTNPGTPGATAGAIQGVAIVVPTGSVLVARAICVTALAVTITVAAAGTTRASNNDGVFPAFAVGEWVGTGASVTPSFTSALGASNNYEVLQFIFTPSGDTAAPVVAAAPIPQRNRRSRGRFM